MGREGAGAGAGIASSYHSTPGPGCCCRGGRRALCCASAAARSAGLPPCRIQQWLTACNPAILPWRRRPGVQPQEEQPARPRPCIHRAPGGEYPLPAPVQRFQGRLAWESVPTPCTPCPNPGPSPRACTPLPTRRPLYNHDCTMTHCLCVLCVLCKAGGLQEAHPRQQRDHLHGARGQRGGAQGARAGHAGHAACWACWVCWVHCACFVYLSAHERGCLGGREGGVFGWCLPGEELQGAAWGSPGPTKLGSYWNVGGWGTEAL